MPVLGSSLVLSKNICELTKSIKQNQESIQQLINLHATEKPPELTEAIVGLMQLQQNAFANQVSILQIELGVAGFLLVAIASVFGWIGFKEIRKMASESLQNSIQQEIEKLRNNKNGKNKNDDINRKDKDTVRSLKPVEEQNGNSEKIETLQKITYTDGNKEEKQK